jgi:CHAD domain-containing protein
MTGTLLDTFEGHLRCSGRLLLQTSSDIVLLDLAEGDTRRQKCLPGWAFANEVQGGMISDHLAALTTLRAFTPICDVKIEQYPMAVMDELSKTVVRGSTTMVFQGDVKATWITLLPLRGYDDDLRQCEKVLMAAGFEPCGETIDYYGLLGLDVDLYTSKPDMDFAWGTPVYESAALIARTFLDVARRNEDGILADHDTEFLHDYRVSLRRVRSMLSLFQKVYDDDDCLQVKNELAVIMKQTNRLRDLDVYLLEREAFYQLVPESMYRGLDTLFQIFERERQDVFQQVCRFLQNDEYVLRMNELQQHFIAGGQMRRGSRADEASGSYAQRTIMKRYNKVAKVARSIHSDTPDAVVHELRIHCKKLRYLLEFFSVLFPAGSMKELVKPIKGLQSLLGRFNDCSVQRESLAQFIKDHPIRGKKGIMLAESIGALVATLYQMQVKSRKQIDSALMDFSNNETGRDFKKLFTEGGSR